MKEKTKGVPTTREEYIGMALTAGFVVLIIAGQVYLIHWCLEQGHELGAMLLVMQLMLLFIAMLEALKRHLDKPQEDDSE